MSGYEVIGACTYGYVQPDSIEWPRYVGQIVRVTEKPRAAAPGEYTAMIAGQLQVVTTRAGITKLAFAGLTELFYLDPDCLYTVAVGQQ